MRLCVTWYSVHPHENSQNISMIRLKFVPLKTTGIDSSDARVQSTR